MFMVIRLPCTYLCIFSAVLVRLCIFYCVANRCVIRQSAMDVLVGSVMFIVRPDGVRVASDNGIF